MPSEDDQEVREETTGERSEKTMMTRPGMQGHQWRQKGPTLYCRSCPIAHGAFIGTNVQLYEIDPDGNPKFRRVSPAGSNSMLPVEEAH